MKPGIVVGVSWSTKISVCILLYSQIMAFDKDDTSTIDRLRHDACDEGTTAGQLMQVNET